MRMILENQEYHTWHIYTDSQAAIRAIDKPQRQSGQAIINEILDYADEIMRTHPQSRIIMTWIPGHAEIEGNERADEEAKKVALESTSIYNLFNLLFIK